MASDALIKKHNFLNPYIDLLTYTIREYDMQEAGFSLIQEFQLLPKEEIDKLKTLTKLERTIAIGKLQLKDEELIINLMQAFIDARRSFYEANKLDDSDILSVKKDAILVINKRCDFTEFGSFINFKLKNIYTSYYHIGNYEIYFNSKDNRMEFKGFNKPHPLINEMKNIFKQYERNKSLVFPILQKLRENYLNKKFDIAYYKELNAKNQYKYMTEFGHQSVYTEECLNIDDIDISYNYNNIIAPLIKILV